MHRTLSLLLALTVLSPALAEEAAAPSEAQPDARTLVKTAFDGFRLPGAEMLATLTILNAAGQERVRQTANVSKLYPDGSEKRLVRFLSPADVKGTGLLTVDYEEKADDLWLFMPALRKTRRIVSSERAKSFMGSEFTYADMTPPPLDDFTYTLMGSDTFDGVECWRIEEKPKSEAIADENGFSRRESWLEKKTLVRRKVVYYDLDGELHRELTTYEVKELDPTTHRYRPMLMKMDNKQNGRRSEMRVEKLNLREDIPDEYFTTRYLERQ